MIVNRQGVLNILGDVRPALNKTEQESVFIFGDGFVEAYNNEVAIRRNVSLKGFKLEGRVLSEGLFSALQKMSSEKVDITKKGNEVILTAGRIKAGIPLLEAGKEKSVLDEGTWKWIDLPEGFLDALKMCQFSVGPESAPPTESCVFVDTKGGKALSCDGFRATRHTFKANRSGSQFLLPGTSLKTVLDFKPTKISVPKQVGTGSDGWVRFGNDDSILALVVFPNDDANHIELVEQLFEFGKDHGKLTFPETLPDIVQRTAIFAKEEMSGDDHVDILASSGVMTFSSSGMRGWIEEEVDVDYKGEEITFSVSAPFLDDVVNLNHRDCLIGEDRMMFDGDQWQHVVSRFIT